jgi:anti-anti-sigma factor
MSSSSGYSAAPEPEISHPAPVPAASAQVMASDGSVIATVSRRVRPAGPGDPGPEVVVSLAGDLDLDTAPLAQENLLRALYGAERVCLDLGEVTFFGAAGVRVVVTARLRAATLGRALRLSGVHGITERVLTLTGLYPED